jgi:Flp pilus assembly protein TadD
MVLGANEHHAEAEKAFREAQRRNPRDPQYSYNLGLILQRQGRVSEALPLFEQTLDLDRSFAPARDRLAELRRQP